MHELGAHATSHGESGLLPPRPGPRSLAQAGSSVYRKSDREEASSRIGSSAYRPGVQN